MSDTERVLRSLRAVAVHVGHEPSVDEYKQAREELRAAGEEVEGITRVIRHFGSWRRAKEALALSETTTAKRIEARSATAGWARSGGPGSPSTRARTVCYVQMFDDRRYPNG